MKKWQVVDLVRSFSIVSVMVVHFGWIYRKIQNPWAAWLWGHFEKNGPYGVFLFFVVSGFLITHILAEDRRGLFNPSLRLFYVRRAGRILPLYFLTILLGVLIYLIHHRGSWQVERFYRPGPGFDLGFWLSIATFTFNWLTFFRRPPILFYGQHWIVLWSLAVEEQFYLLYPLALRKIASPQKFHFFLIMIILAAFFWRLFCYLFFPRYGEWPICNPLGVFDLIAIGALLYLAFQRYGESLSKNKGRSLALCTAGLVLIASIYLGTSYDNPLDRVYAPLALGLGSFGFLLGGLHLPFFDSKFLRIAALPGQYCYGIYLLHSTVFCFIEPFFLQRFNTFIAFGIVAVLATTIGWISYRLFEMPMNHLIRKTFSKLL